MKTTIQLILAIWSLGMASFAQEQAPAVTHNTWTSGTAMPTARMGAAAIASGANIYVNGTLYAVCRYNNLCAYNLPAE